MPVAAVIVVAVAKPPLRPSRPITEPIQKPGCPVRPPGCSPLCSPNRMSAA